MIFRDTIGKLLNLRIERANALTLPPTVFIADPELWGSMPSYPTSPMMERQTSAQASKKLKDVCNARCPNLPKAA